MASTPPDVTFSSVSRPQVQPAVHSTPSVSFSKTAVTFDELSQRNTSTSSNITLDHHPPYSSKGRKETTRLVSRDSACEYVNEFKDEPEYAEIVREAEIAIDNGVYPEMIYQGSSGSYFVKNCSGVCINV